MGAKLNNLVGLKFNRLLVLDKIESKAYGKYKKRQWKCLCDCGNIAYAITSQLKNNLTKSCGCLHKEYSSINGINSRHKVAKHNTGYNTIYSAYKNNARNRGLSFDLDKDYFIKLLSMNCSYCGIEPSSIYDKSYYRITYNGIDRIDNNIGYIKSNVVTCCKICNIAKNNLSFEDFYDWVHRIINNKKNLEKIQTIYDAQRHSDYQKADSRNDEGVNTRRETEHPRTSL